MGVALGFSVGPLRAGQGRLPLLVEATEPDTSLLAVFEELSALVDEHLLRDGGILFRGFTLAGAEQFREFAASFGHPLLSYEFGSTPRSSVTQGVYTSTEYPAHQRIPLHNEQAYSRDWPMRIWFYSMIAAQSGGETPIADSREVYKRIPAYIRERFVSKGLMYVRNFGNGLDVAWEQVFNTEDRAVAEAYCKAHAITCEWKDDGELRTRQICQAVARHPRTGEMVWFNQAHLFHISNLQPEVRESLLDIVDEEDLPRNVYYGDGTPIEDEVLNQIRAVLDDCMISFPWQSGDVLMLDNMLAAHARAPFEGPRKVIVAMAEGFSADQL
ncbi:Taurine dioxygenase, alpha-ketoglutarate-dependent [Pseudomonas gessardii]|uniref:TauD/TfdA family dioxygenase n=1 Tax=Pseudomonas gessardii TaxID=78544 RepID=A0A7Y1MRX8_9PSED|nr:MULTISPECIES: TauD/TfdA family dioxygenase [Pseudomonas]MCF4979989.1 TauD/TfdA family dioxygenase [Pseudomonas gessardii]MCF4990077.1 TauD/TfdA family dioxygenase [Pseudomonas gessardii]MCF5083985.1 TauD/TfdA family dioxygenase [Pseudomonas gessardii]MCF5095428.1 TauD/TfdA family dioxygenase [Pseudomonas gessardii]MCF5107382.1 TauD/TfdA family dioxygenase [Pseudomonas gessardii]